MYGYSLVKMRKAQSALEFIILAAFMLGVFLLFFAGLSSQIVDVQVQRDEEVVVDLSTTVVNELMLARNSLSGYQRSFFLPQTIGRENYTLTVLNQSELIIRYKENNYVTTLPFAINGSVYKGENIVYKINQTVKIFSSDPCVDSVTGERNITGNNSFCIGGECRCEANHYDRMCGYEDDFVVAQCGYIYDNGEAIEQYNCTNFDYCNVPPYLVEGSLIKDTTDTTATIQFKTTEKARARIDYSKASEAELLNSVFDNRLIQNFKMVIPGLSPLTSYNFRINLSDLKNARSEYPQRPAVESFVTLSDISAPVIDSSSLAKEGNIVYLWLNMTEWTGFGEAQAVVKRTDGSNVSVYGLSEVVSSSPYYNYSTTITIDNTFDNQSSYGFVSGTLLYSSFNNGTDGTRPAASADSSGVDLVDAKFSKGVELKDVNDKLLYDSTYFNKDEGTIEMWVKPNWGWSLTKHVFFDLAATETANRYVLRQDSGWLIFSVFNKDGAEFIVKKNINWNAGEWHFIAATWDLSDENSFNSLSLFLDGFAVEDTSCIISGTFFPTCTSGIVIDNLDNSYSIGNSKALDLPADAVVDQLRVLNYKKTYEEMYLDYVITRNYDIDFYLKDSNNYGKYYKGVEEFSYVFS